MEQDVNKENPANEEMNKSDTPTIIQTDEGAKDGQNKCPKCGATDISLNINNGKLRCNFCRHEFEPQKVNELDTDLSKLEGQVMGSGATNIVADVKDIITLKCTSCGAEVVIDTASSAQARCHWCRNTLSINQQIPNGSIPDLVLPFKVKKEEAQEEIKKFVEKRKFFAHPKFKAEFTTNNIMGVYLPYMLVGANTHASFIGEGEILKRRYTVGSGDDKKTYYDADLYHVERDFDLTVSDLSIESSKDKLNASSTNTNNVINAIMPFDTENCVKFDANYLKGFSSEKRDTNVDELKEIVEIQTKDVARFAANDTLKQYDRGINWKDEQLKIKGQQWKSAYLPVWLYSYLQVNGENKLLHYVAVNARTKETMGSVPIHMPKLLLISFLVEVLGIILMLLVDWDSNWLFLLSGIIFFIIIYLKYRNSNARHTYEKETKTQMNNLKKKDEFIKTEKGLSNSMIDGVNNNRVYGSTIGSKLLSSVTGENIVNSLTNSNPIAGLVKKKIDSNKEKQQEESKENIEENKK